MRIDILNCFRQDEFWSVEGVGTMENKSNACKAIGYEYDEKQLNYRLVWSDEFDLGNRPNPSKWSYDAGVHFNNELQYYTDAENAVVEDGRLIITAKKQDRNGFKYTSARLVSKNKGDWLYGKFDISAKLPLGIGTWPAIWMLPTKNIYGRWPKSGEIDIMEHVGYNQDQIHFSAHTHEYNHTKKTEITKFTHIENVSGSFHKYSLEWLPDKLKFFVDDKLHFTYKPADLSDCPDYTYWPFDRKFHLVLNIAVGGFWGGVKGVDDSIFPQAMEIEYVKVYQADEINNLNMV
jgi:beta-glucanase (GH16 family)